MSESEDVKSALDGLVEEYDSEDEFDSSSGEVSGEVESEGEFDSLDEEDASSVEDEPVESPSKEDRLSAEWDKRMQKFDQFFATVEKKQADHAANPSKETAAALEKAVSNLAKFQGRDADSIDPFTDVPELAGEVDKALQERDAKIAELQEQIKAAAGAQGMVQSELAEIRFDRQYPELAGKYGELTAKAREYADSFVGGETGPAADKIWEKLANGHLEKLRQEALDAAKAAKSESVKEVVPKPKGTKTVSRSSSAAKATVKKSAEERQRELLDGLVERVEY